MCYPFQFTGRPISHRNGWSFCVYMIQLRDFVLKWNSRPGARTWVNSRRGDSHGHGILWWYDVNKYRIMRVNQSELAPGPKSPRCHVNTPLQIQGWKWRFGSFIRNYNISKYQEKEEYAVIMHSHFSEFNHNAGTAMSRYIINSTCVTTKLRQNFKVNTFLSSFLCSFCYQWQWCVSWEKQQKVPFYLFILL